jgi:hypothetical protein
VFLEFVDADRCADGDRLDGGQGARASSPVTAGARPVRTRSVKSASPAHGEISAVGFDDSCRARLDHVDLTTVGQDIARLAQLAVGRAVARLEGEAPPEGQGQEIVIEPHLVTRDTTAARGSPRHLSPRRSRPRWR